MLGKTLIIGGGAAAFFIAGKLTDKQLQKSGFYTAAVDSSPMLEQVQFGDLPQLAEQVYFSAQANGAATEAYWHQLWGYVQVGDKSRLVAEFAQWEAKSVAPVVAQQAIQVAMPAMAQPPAQQPQPPKATPQASAPAPSGGEVDYSKAIVNALLPHRLSVRVDNIIAGPQVNRYQISLRGGTVEALKKRIVDVQVALKLDKLPAISTEQGISIDIPRTHRKTLEMTKYWPQLPTTEGIAFPVGVDLYGKIQWANLNDEPHLLIAGRSGGGKSSLGRTILANLHRFYGPGRLQLALCDPKRVELGPFFQNSPLVWKVGLDVQEIAEIVADVVAEMADRYETMEDCKVLHSDDLPSPPPRIILWIDELADLTVDPGFVANLSAIARKGRAAGIHIIGITQRPDANTVPPQIRSNIGGRICLRVKQIQDSSIILGGNDDSGISLTGNGDMIFQWGDIDKRLQGFWLSAEEMQAVIDQSAQAYGGATDDQGI